MNNNRNRNNDGRRPLRNGFKRRNDSDEKRASRSDDEQMSRKPYSRRDGEKRGSRFARKDGEMRASRFGRHNNEENDTRSERKERGSRFGREDGEMRGSRFIRRNNEERGTRSERDGREERGSRFGRHNGGRFNRDDKARKDYKTDRAIRANEEGYEVNEGEHRGAKNKTPQKQQNAKGLIRLNKYISNAGICSRREADLLIAAGSVTVNGKVVTEMGFKVSPDDVVAYGGETLRSETKRYFLLNKPKGFITTVDDPQERQTVMMLVDGACNERIYPVGRLDRNTTGLLLFTNDGEMAKKLTHPSTGVYKIYHVELNKPVTRDDMQKMLDGITLEDGEIHVDDVQYVTAANDKRVVGVELHSGKNRIVRRIFEHLGYEVHKLDRVVFAGLTKKDLPRGRYRELTEKEVSFLKMI